MTCRLTFLFILPLAFAGSATFAATAKFNYVEKYGYNLVGEVLGHNGEVTLDHGVRDFQFDDGYVVYSLMPDGEGFSSLFTIDDQLQPRDLGTSLPQLEYVLQNGQIFANCGEDEGYLCVRPDLSEGTRWIGVTDSNDMNYFNVKNGRVVLINEDESCLFWLPGTTAAQMVYDNSDNTSPTGRCRLASFDGTDVDVEIYSGGVVTVRRFNILVGTYEARAR